MLKQHNGRLPLNDDKDRYTEYDKLLTIITKSIIMLI